MATFLRTSHGMVMGPLCLLLALCVGQGAAEEEWKNLHVKWNVLDGFYELPTTLDAALDAGFVYMIHDGYLNVKLYSYDNDPNLGLMFDTYGNIAGIRMGYIKKDVVALAESKNLTFPDYFSDKSMYGDTDYWGKDVWTNTVLFTSPTILKAGGRNDTGGLVADDLYVKLYGTWTLMPRSASDAPSLNFTRQKCFLGTGLHYFHGMTSSADCLELQGVYLMYTSISKELIGLGFAPWGSYATPGVNKTWFETITDIYSDFIISDGPACLNEYIDNYGVSSMHIFLNANPRLTLCL